MFLKSHHTRGYFEYIVVNVLKIDVNSLAIKIDF